MLSGTKIEEKKRKTQKNSKLDKFLCKIPNLSVTFTSLNGIALALRLIFLSARAEIENSNILMIFIVPILIILALLTS